MASQYLKSFQPLYAASLADLQTAEAAGEASHEAIVYVKTGVRVIPYCWDGSAWSRAGWAVSLEADSALRMGAGGVLGIDDTRYASPAAVSAAISGVPGQVNADWNSNAGLSQILNRPALGSAALQDASAFSLVAHGHNLASSSNNGYMSAAQFDLLALQRRKTYVKTLVSVGTANSDASTFTGLPAKYIITRFSLFDASSSLTTATMGLFTAAAGGGTAIVALSIVTAATPTVVFDFTAAVAALYRTSPTLFARVGVAKASTTVSLLLEIIDLT